MIIKVGDLESHHSNRGSQNASGDYQTLLDEQGMTCSMSRKGDCWDNARCIAVCLQQ